ncbi:TlpA disulfide reductase family protein [Flavobacteriaceae bacterium KMM 6898]|nr:TlpA disulfide reductase family protein [Flavobacteriaceae bacterium KMM 6898]
MTVRYLTIILASIFLLSCKEDIKTDFALISGGITGSTIDTIYIQKDGYAETFTKHAIPILKNQTFFDTLDLGNGYYKLTVGNNTYGLYLEPKFDLKLKIKEQNGIIKYAGLGQKENNYLTSKKELHKRTFSVDHYKHFSRLEENQFLKTNDSIRSLYLTLLSQSKIDNEQFVSLERKSILLDRVYNLMGYEGDKRLLTDQKDFEVSSSFPNPIELIDFNDEGFLEIPFFIPLLANNQYFFMKNKVNLDTTTEILKCVDCDLNIEYLNFMGKYLKNKKVKNGATFLIAKWMIGKTENIDTFYNSYKSFNSESKNLNYISNIYKNLKSTRGRDFLMKTELIDADDKDFTLEDFQGKYLYLDFWSSSCKPCLQEFDNFNELSKELSEQKIVFIGINIWDTKERWQQTVKKYDLSGIQLTAGKNLKFLDSLGVNGIPRYMLVNDIGNVMDFNAKRPSEIGSIAEFEKMIAE